jgi:hypothetical protein
MARYNTIQVSNQNSGTQIIAPNQGVFTEFIGTAPYSVVLPDPRIYFGTTQSFYNSTIQSAGVTLQLSSAFTAFFVNGVSQGQNLTMPPGSSITIASDGTNYNAISFYGGAQFGTTGTFSGDLITTNTGTVNVFNTTATTVNAFGAATSLSIGATSGTTTINNQLLVKGGTVTVNSTAVKVEDKNIEIGYVNPISYGTGNIQSVGGSLSASTYTVTGGSKNVTTGSYSNVPVYSTTSVYGTGATFNVTFTGTVGTYSLANTTITINQPGTGYAVNDQIVLPGSSLGGVTTTNNLTFTISGPLSSPFISTVTQMTSATNLPTNASVTATAGAGSLGSGATSTFISSVLSTAPGASSIQITTIGGTTPTTGLITNITPGAADAYAVGGGILLYGTTNHTLTWTNAAVGPLSGNTNGIAWQSSEGLQFTNATASNYGIQNSSGANFNMLTNGVVNGTFNLATTAATVNAFSAATSINIGPGSTSTTTINGTTFTLSGITTINATSSPTFNATGLWGQWNKASFGTTADPGSGAILATGNITAYYSDDRLKTRLGNIENALEKLETLTGFYYEANQTAQDLGYEVKREVGVSAQDVQKILPEIVKPAPIDAKYMTIHYEKLIPLVIEAVKELSAEVKAIKAQISKE